MFLSKTTFQVKADLYLSFLSKYSYIIGVLHVCLVHLNAEKGELSVTKFINCVDQFFFLVIIYNAVSCEFSLKG